MTRHWEYAGENTSTASLPILITQTGTWELEYNLKLEFLVLVHVLVQAFRKPGADESSSELK